MAANYPTRKKARTPAVIVETPEILEHPPKEENVRYIEGANGSKYKVVGVCLVCGIEVHQYVSGPTDPAIEHTTCCVIVPNSRPIAPTRNTIPEPPTYYCQQHHPFPQMRNRHGKKLEGGATVDGDSWSPLR